MLQSPAVRCVAAALMLAATAAPAAANAVDNWACATGSRSDAPAKDWVALPGVHAVSGHIRFIEGTSGPGWQPHAAITLRTAVPPGEEDCGCTGLMAFLIPDPDGGLKVQYEVHGNGGGEPFAQARPGVAITFRVSVTDDLLSVSIGKTDPVTKSVKLRYPPTGSLFLTCTSANVEFFDIRTE